MIQTLGDKVAEVVAKHGPVPAIEKDGNHRWYDVKRALRRLVQNKDRTSKGWWLLTNKKATFFDPDGSSCSFKLSGA